MRIDHKEFLTGVPAIDRQHEAYLALVERVFRLCGGAQVERERLAAEVNAALSYAIEHFDTEEHLMRSVNYPHLDQHVAKHNVFRGRVDDFAAELRCAEPAPDFTTRLAKWLVDWFAEQVQNDDQRLANFLKKTAPSPAAPGRRPRNSA
jgi:hemerythrin